MSFIGILIYLAPAILGWILRRAAPGISPGRLFAANLFLGWTVIGWFGCVGYVFYHLAKGRRGGPLPDSYFSAASAAPNLSPGAPHSVDTAPQRVACSSCTGGQARCGLCGGQRGAHRDNVWVPCTYCLGSGTVQCMSCGGSGYTR